MEKNKKVALVTGSTRGIGLGVLGALCQQGYLGIMTGRQTNPQIEEKQEEIRQTGGDCAFYPLDLADSKSRTALIEEISCRFGRLDLLVNNAGIAPPKRMDLLETTQESFDLVVNTNLKGTFFMTQLAANFMVAKQKQGLADFRPRIINVSSISAYTSSVARGEYCVSKAGISMVTALFADRLSEFGIPVFEIRPGIIKTDMTAVVEDKYTRMIQEGLTPIKRWGLPEDIARAVLALAGGSLDFSTGQVINVDGGFHLRRLN